MKMTELWLPTDIDLTNAPKKASYKFKAALASGEVNVAVSDPDQAGIIRTELVVTTRLPLAKPKEQVMVADYKLENGKGFWRNMGAKPDVPASARFVFAAALPFTFCLGGGVDQEDDIELACVIGSKTYLVKGKRTASGKSEADTFALAVPISKATKPQILEVEIKDGILESARVKLPVFGDGRLWRVN